MVAKTFFGFEELLANELKNLGGADVKVGNRMVSFYGDTGFMYKANLCLRTALKVLKPIAEKKVKDPEALYTFVKSIDWRDYLDANDTFAVYATVNSDYFNHSKYVALRIQINISRDLCTISLDSSGDSLHHRGYRTATNIAPINEVLAAGLLLHSGWRGQSDFLDPMCGSGTMLIEAAMIACNIPVNINRKEFAFEKWLDWDMDLYEKIEASVLKKVRDCNVKIEGFDKAPSAIQKAIDNIENANISEFVTVKRQDFFESVKESDDEKSLHMVFNPPYGERLPIDMQTFYGQVGDTLKKEYSNTEAWFITSDLEALKYVGLRPSRKIKVFNAKLEARLVNYKMYAGSKRTKFQKN